MSGKDRHRCRSTDGRALSTAMILVVLCTAPRPRDAFRHHCNTRRCHLHSATQGDVCNTTMQCQQAMSSSGGDGSDCMDWPLSARLHLSPSSSRVGEALRAQAREVSLAARGRRRWQLEGAHSALKPLGLVEIHRQESAHMSSRPSSATHPSSALARAGAP